MSGARHWAISNNLEKPVCHKGDMGLCLLYLLFFFPFYTPHNSSLPPDPGAAAAAVAEGGAGAPPSPRGRPRAPQRRRLRAVPLPSD